MTPETALIELTARADPARAADMAAHHKAARVCLGVANPEIDTLAKGWRADCTLEDRLALAAGLWASDIHEARIAAAKLLTQARIRPDDAGAWRLIASWVPDFDTRAIADAAAIAGQKRLVADPARLDEVEAWTRSPHMWTRRAALVMTLPWTRQRHPKPADIAVRERVLGWAASSLDDRDRLLQTAVAWWLRDLSKRDPERVRTFLDAQGARMIPLARREAARHLP